MKTYTILALLFMTAIFTETQAQVLNDSFESVSDTLPTQPEHWKFRDIKDVDFSITSETKNSGENSFKVVVDEYIPNQWIAFSQYLDYKTSEVKRVVLSYYMKTENLTESTRNWQPSSAGIWWQVLNKENKQIDFVNSGMKDLNISGTTDWKKYELVLTINKDCDKFYLGGYVSDNGTVWFDDITVRDLELELEDTPPSKDVKRYLKKFTKIVKKNAIYGDKLDWKSINKELAILSRGINSMDDLGAPKDYILKKLREVGDNHSFLQTKETFDTSTKTQVTSEQPHSKLLENNIGYISIPMLMTRNKDVEIDFATKIQNLIKELDTQNNIEAWVVDLRNDRGGNMHPMLAGLGSLTGNGLLGHFISHRTGKKKPWFYKDGGFGLGKEVTVQVKNPYVLKNMNPKIALLIGNKTSSSGEMTAIAFLGKVNLKSFGQVSGGYTSVNNDFKLPNGDVVYLASSYVSDRNNIKYPKNITPEVLIEENEEGVDKTLNTAMEWLNKEFLK